MPKPAHPHARDRRISCAIYTRKSTDEGLEKEFNSLDAQREACAAYILSQRHEGWIAVLEVYDDGGFSGGNMERPGLKRLLADVETGKVDVVVLYKIDRLTRSLADFARIVEILDRAGASFVSITQAFNTTTSMGRLTLNVLLSFAQFEREVTGERIRDKVAASKAKGMWMGGVVSLGYRVHERKLIVDEAEAETVRMIFERYVELGSTSDLADELTQRGITSKVRQLSNGDRYGGRPFSRGALAHLLQNRLYIGEVTHRDQAHPGEHQPIIERDLWDRVQVLLASNRTERRTSSRVTEPSLLTGLISDGLGRPMSPTHATKGSRRYRYYVSRVDGGGPGHRPWRLPAQPIERLVLSRLTNAIGEGHVLAERLASPATETSELVRQRSRELAQRFAAPSEARDMLAKLAAHIHVHDDHLRIELGGERLLELVLGGDADWLTAELSDASSIELLVPVHIRRRGQELRLVFPPADRETPAQVDAKLVELLAKAHEARTTLADAEADVGAAERPHLTRLARLSYLAPDIITAIVDGRQPANLSARQLLRTRSLPACWAQQRAMLGFA